MADARIKERYFGHCGNRLSAAAFAFGAQPLVKSVGAPPDLLDVASAPKGALPTQGAGVGLPKACAADGVVLSESPLEPKVNPNAAAPA